MKKLLYVIGIMCLLTACSLTRNLQEGETLYTGIKKLSVEDRDKSAHGAATLEEVEAALSYPPNGAIFGSSSLRNPLQIGLRTYNAWVNHQRGWLGKWLFNTFASNPVYISTVNPATRVKVAQNVLRNYGYFSGVVGYDTVAAGKRKAKLNYTVRMGGLHTLDSIEYRGFPNGMDSLLKTTERQRVLRKGNGFSAADLENERTRLSDLFRNHGYFFYRPDYTMYEADTVQAAGKVQLRVSPDPAVP